MAKISQDNNHQDDQVLAKLYKEGAKETPPAKLNSEILNYAANANTSIASTHVGSHFGGGWKVPLSMAASVVVVFALLVQLDQSPQQLELPPIPEIPVPTEDSANNSSPASKEYNKEHFEAEEALTDDDYSFKSNHKKSDLDSQNTGALIIDNPASTDTQKPTGSIQTKPAIIKQDTIKDGANKNAEKKAKTLRERAQLQKEPTAIASEPVPSPLSSTTKSKSLNKPQTAQKQAPIKDNLGGNAPNQTSGSSSSTIMQKRSMSESRDDSRISSDMAADTELAEEMSDEQVQTKTGFAPIPIEDWLLMIEKLVAQKDYAEAARQLEKFKQAHPKVNVEDLDAKIP